MRLKDQVAIVVGAAWGGIGGATALRFAEEGARLVVTTRSSEAELNETVERIQAIGGEAVGVLGDATDEAAWQRVVDTALTRYGKITRLVYNPTYTISRRVADYTREEWQRSLDVILNGAWLAAKFIVPEMIRAGGGALVFISSINSLATNPAFGAYATAKAGLNALARSIALDYGRDGIRANAIAPGSVLGERNKALILGDPLEETANRDCYPIGRYGRPEDIANVALFLASDEAAFVTGIVLVADGGHTLQLPEALVRPGFRLRWRDDVLVPQDPTGHRHTAAWWD
jgi:NAD(P)-dependent dehydrogenase (short-subunit alcohol dehydrogenase family)